MVAWSTVAPTFLIFTVLCSLSPHHSLFYMGPCLNWFFGNRSWLSLINHLQSTLFCSGVHCSAPVSWTGLRVGPVPRPRLSQLWSAGLCPAASALRSALHIDFLFLPCHNPSPCDRMHGLWWLVGRHV